jgi:hypothetical protein
MSETGFVPGQMRAAESDTRDDEAQDNSRRNLLMAFGGLAALAIVGVVAWLLLFSGGSDESAPVTSAPSNVSQPVAPSTSPSPVVIKPAASTRIRHGFRDPFKALIAPVAASSLPAEAGVSGGTAADPPPVVTQPGEAPAVAPSDSATTTTHLFQVVSIAPDNSTSTVKVDGKRFNDIAIDVAFAELFKAVRYEDGKCGVFQFGEERFDLCEGKTVRMQ